MSSDDESHARGLRRLRRYTFFTLIGSGPLSLFMSASFLASSDMDPTVLPLAAGAVVGSVVFCTSALALHWHGEGMWRRRIFWGLGAALLVAGAAVEASTHQIGDAWAAPAGLLVAEVTLWAPRGKRARALMTGSACAVALVAVLASAGLMARESVLMAMVLVAVVAATPVCQLWHYQVALDLEEARGLAAKLAVAEERLRFAGELHDIQGGNLQAITLKAQVARRLLDRDPGRAAEEIHAVEELARTALKDTREVVGGYRKVALTDEIDSAARILKSAGVQATVPDEAPTLDADTEKLLGLLVREATTNLIRHAEPTAANVSIVEVDAQITVTVTNNGAPEPTDGGHGLSMLVERFGEAGGKVEHEHDGDRFVLKGTLPKAPAPMQPLRPLRIGPRPRRAVRR
ncbi:histidine kinase [Glycomyces sp. NPDC046736]|uniref:sensor histidine kinase n=1 Tax=Glycomyces sp. NPDC046736 TaxID=3155615 RepID=UPI0033D56AEB